MKVLLLNGSPKKAGSTYTALSEVAGQLEAGGVETEILHVVDRAIIGCTACGYCKTHGRCVFAEDKVNQVLEQMPTVGGLVFGSPTYYASSNGAFHAFLDRLFYAGSGELFANKAGAAVAVSRRAGTTSNLDSLNKYFTISNMMIVGSQYWNMVHGNSSDEVQKDAEGMQTMRRMGENMAWLLKSIEAGKAAGIPLPKGEERIWTNFIR